VNGVPAFAGRLQTGGPLAGLSPPMGPMAKPLVISRSVDFVVTWTPEGMTDEAVGLVLVQPQISERSENESDCLCAAPDAAGRLTLSAAQLSAAFGPSTTGQITVRRFIVRTVAAGAASVQLVGYVATGGVVMFE
jgi:hypothetical protein